MKITPGKRIFLENEEDIIKLQPCEYYLSKDGNLFFCYPGTKAGENGVPGYIASINKTWKITENADKTLTVSPSILVKGDQHLPSWHGYLRNGNWEEC